ncbi:hypothetical protein H4683_002554 [Filibacter limicola]|uniref:Competence pheromone ComX n=1 Tax=Sporosarcina limicola TaxID=34101 RepID=A0A927R6Z7_9BACL|nr:hypothetical protein [Sporosarcina limicola]
MSKIIQYLIQNPNLIALFLEEKICLLNFKEEVDNKALYEVLNGKIMSNIKYWK